MLKKIKFLKKNDTKNESKTTINKKDGVSNEKINKKQKKQNKEKANKKQENIPKKLTKEEKSSFKSKEEISQSEVLDDKQSIIKRMSKKDLLQLLIVQRKKINELEIELQYTKESLESKEIIIKNSGSIAEASLKLNKVFEIAQEAANQYLENVKKISKNKEK